MGSSHRKETQRTRLTGLWQAIRRWLTAHTFAPSWIPGRWAHPAVGYLAAVVVQIIVVTGLVSLIRLFPSFQFQEAVLILVVLVVALTWGVGPSLVATVVGGMLLVLLLLPPVYSLTIPRIEDVLDLLVYLAVGCAVSLLTSQVQRARRSVERERGWLDTIQQAMTDAVLVYDNQEQLVHWNAAAEQLFAIVRTDDTVHALAERGRHFCCGTSRDRRCRSSSGPSGAF